MAVRILIDSGNYFSDNDNLGDRAVYQVMARRLRRLWPSAEIRFITQNEPLIAATCPDVRPFVLTERHGTEVLPEVERFLDAIRDSDLVLATGGGYFSDCFAEHALGVLDTLEAGLGFNKPAAILGCGFESICHPKLAAKAHAVLPRLSMIACREALHSPTILRSFGVLDQTFEVTGDDAVELAYELRPESLGEALGVNLRRAGYSSVHESHAAALRTGLQRAARMLQAKLLPVPISLFGPSDPESIRHLITGQDAPLDDGRYLDTTQAVARQVGRCRLVVTGSYHAAVFALSQGVSVVAVAGSQHYVLKLGGLQGLFGAGCHILQLGRDADEENLLTTIDEAWRNAPAVRPQLLEAARVQIAAGWDAYRRLHDVTGCSRGRHPVQQTLHAPSFRRPPMSKSATQRQSFVLSGPELAKFREQGFLGPFTAFEPHEMERMRRIIVERVLTTPTPYCPFARRIRHLDSRTVFELCSAPAIVERMAALYGPDLVLWGSNLLDKPPAEPGQLEEYPWHQDHYNWQLEPVLNISAWIAITPATPENGCVEVIPGSHRCIVPPVQETDERHSLRFGGVASDPAYIDESKKLRLALAPGQFFLFNERLLHHSNPNRTRTNRLGLAIRVTTPIVKVSEPFPCLLLCGQDRMGFNRYADPPADEPDSRWFTNLPEGHEFVFDRPVPGLGWHVLESDGRRQFAWTGLEPEAWIDLRPVAEGDHVLTCEVLHALTPQALDEVRMRVNDQPLAIQRRSHGAVVVLEGRVPSEVLQRRSDHVRISLHVPQLVRPCDINSASKDNRKLGLGVSRIALRPVGEELRAVA